MRRRLGFALALASTLVAAPGAAQSAASAEAGAIGAPAGSLPPLPRAPSTELPKATAAETEELDALLTRLTGEDAAARDRAAGELLELTQNLLPAIDARLNRIADGGEKAALRDLLEKLRKRGRDAERERMGREGERGKVKTPDYLKLALAEAAPSNKAWRELVVVLGLMRALTQMGSTPAVRELIDVHVRFGDFVRVDVQLRLEALGDKALPALIETRRHKAEKIARWSERMLDTLGKSIPSEVVQTPDPEVLADALRAYGRTKDPDAARVVVGFANTERALVREAARQGVTMLGEVGNWQLREAYENLVGKRPPRDWSWDRVARELFHEFDRRRSIAGEALFEEGVAAGKAGALDRQKRAFDAVLARSPNSPHAAALAAGYLAYAHRYQDEDREGAIDALLRAERLSESTARPAIQSLRLTLEAESLLAAGVADPSLLRRAIELDANNSRAKSVLARTERGEADPGPQRRRIALAGGIGGLGLVALGALAWLRRRRRREPAAPLSTEVLGNDVPPNDAPVDDTPPQHAPLDGVPTKPGRTSRVDEPPVAAPVTTATVAPAAAAAPSPEAAPPIAPRVPTKKAKSRGDYDDALAELEAPDSKDPEVR